MPKGSLIIKDNKNRFSFYQKIDNQLHGITREKTLIKALARKCHVNNCIVECEDNCDALKKALQIMDNRKHARSKALHKITYRRIKTLLDAEVYELSEKEKAWAAADYDKNTYKPEYLKYQCMDGTKVRSKSERIIADMLSRHRILYRYEAGIEVDGTVYYPDFTILRRDGTQVLLEHFGLMEKQEYSYKTYLKLEQYRKLGYKQHSNLICTYEEDLISVKNLEDIMARYGILH